MKNKHPQSSEEYWKNPIIKKIQDTSLQVDQNQPVEVPDSKWFEELVIREQKQLRQKLWKDLMLLWAIALIIFAALTASVLLVPIFFLLVQVAVLFAFYYLYRQEKKRVNEHERYTAT